MNLQEFKQELESIKLSAFIQLMYDYGVEFDTDEQAEDLLKTIQEL